MRAIFFLALGVSMGLAGEIRIDGELTGDLSKVDGYVVDVRPLDRPSPGERALVDHKGNFTVTVPGSGSYEVRVTTLHGNSVKTEFVNISEFRSNISIRLPETASTASGAVSLRTLRHKVPKEARKEFDRSSKALRAKKHAEAVAHLEKAVAIDPDYMEAHNNLGVRYYESENFEASLRHFRAALHLEPGAGEVAANTAAALAALRRFPEAEQAARRALALGDTSPKARYLLALSLLGTGKNPGECRALLEETAPVIPHARKVLSMFNAFQSGSGRSK